MKIRCQTITINKSVKVKKPNRKKTIIIITFIITLTIIIIITF